MFCGVIRGISIGHDRGLTEGIEDGSTCFLTSLRSCKSLYASYRIYLHWCISIIWIAMCTSHDYAYPFDGGAHSDPNRDPTYWTGSSGWYILLPLWYTVNLNNNWNGDPQLANAIIAFLLNVAAVWLVGVGGGLVLTLAGVFKVSKNALIPYTAGPLFWPPFFQTRIFSSSRAPCSSSIRISRLFRSSVSRSLRPTVNRGIFWFYLTDASPFSHFSTLQLDDRIGYSIALGGLIVYRTSGSKK
jgi:hypothetical protein